MDKECVCVWVTGNKRTKGTDKTGQGCDKEEALWKREKVQGVCECVSKGSEGEESGGEEGEGEEEEEGRKEEDEEQERGGEYMGNRKRSKEIEKNRKVEEVDRCTGG